MLRFLKKRFKHSEKPVPPENPPHQTTDTSEGCGRDSEGEYRSGKISADKADKVGSTTTPEDNRGGGSQIANQSFLHRIPQPKLPDMGMATQVSAVECNCWGQCLFSIAHQGRGHTHGGSAEAQRDQPGCSAPGLRSTKGDQNRREHQGQGSDIQQPSETTPERALQWWCSVS